MYKKWQQNTSKILWMFSRRMHFWFGYSKFINSVRRLDLYLFTSILHTLSFCSSFCSFIDKTIANSSMCARCTYVELEHTLNGLIDLFTVTNYECVQANKQTDEAHFFFAFKYLLFSPRINYASIFYFI